MIDPVSTLNSFVPSSYQQLGMQWGLNPSYAGLVAFAASILLMWGIFYFGMWLAFGNIIANNDKSEEYKKIFIIISAGLAIYATLGAADLVVLILSNIIYIFGIGAAIIIVASIFRAITSGWHGAGATVTEAKIKEFDKIKKLEYKKIAYAYALDIAKRTLLEIIADVKTLDLDKNIGIYRKIKDVERDLQKIKKLTDIPKLVGRLREQLTYLKQNLEQNNKSADANKIGEYISKLDRILEELKTEFNSMQNKGNE